jgi:Ca2+-binding RTX toxin-like protein
VIVDLRGRWIVNVRPLRPLVGVLAVVLAILRVPGSAAAEPVGCQGEVATVVITADGTTGATTDGHDVVAVFGAHSVDAGGGDDLLCVWGVPADTDGGGATIEGGPGRDSLTARTGRGADFLDVRDLESLEIWMGGGFDELRLSGIRGTGTLDAGAGRGVIKMLEFDRVRLDMEDELLRLDRGAGDYRVLRFYRAFASGDRVSLTGERHRNGLRARACRATLWGGRADDVLEAVANRHRGCRALGARLLGQRGDDRLTGTSLDDVLLGGPGRDKAFGRRGNDRCVAEVRVGCER